MGIITRAIRLWLNKGSGHQVLQRYLRVKHNINITKKALTKRIDYVRGKNNG